MTVYIVVRHTSDGPENCGVYSSKAEAEKKRIKCTEKFPDDEYECWIDYQRSYGLKKG